MGLIQKLSSVFSKNKAALKKASEKIWRFREPRLAVTNLKNVSFIPDQPFSSEPYLIANISSGGIAFIKNSATQSVVTDALFQGTLRVNEDKLQVTMKVLRVSPEIVACKFNSASTSLDQVLKKYFDIEIAAMKMYEMKTELLEPSSEGTPFCFNGENHNKLYFLVNEESVDYFEFSFFGNYIEGVRGKKLNYGNLVTSDLRESIRYAQSTLISSKTSVSDDIKNTASSFLESIEKLNSAHRTEITNAIRLGHF